MKDQQEQQSLQLPPWLVRLQGLRDRREAFKATHPFITNDIQRPAVAKEQKVKNDAPPEPGQEMEDGTFYLGRFKNKDGTEKDWFAAADDARSSSGQRLALKFKQAADHACFSKAHGRFDWKIPPGHEDDSGEPDILNEIFNNKAKIGGFNENKGELASFYWTSTPQKPYFRRCQNFGDGVQSRSSGWGLSLRLVRSVPVV